MIWIRSEWGKEELRMTLIVWPLVYGTKGHKYMAFERGFPGGSDGKESAYNAGDLGSIPGSGRSGGVHGNPFSILNWRIPWTA